MTTCAVIVYGPDFAGSENLVPALSQRHVTKLISLHPSDWRHYDEGILMTTDRGKEEARAFVETADLIFLGDAMSINALAVACPDTDWLAWTRRRNNIVAYFGDSAYHYNARMYDGILTELNIKRLFLLPNLMPMTTLDAVPLHHPVPVTNTEKADKLTIVHAPGRMGKATAKGTIAIEEIIDNLALDFKFSYKRLEGYTIETCLKLKSQAHIVIDQLPQPGLIHGLGRVGVEALGCGSAVMSKMYDYRVLQGFFNPPPVIDIRTPADLCDKLRGLLENTELLKSSQCAALEWAADNVAYGKWLEYIEKYL